MNKITNPVISNLGKVTQVRVQRDSLKLYPQGFILNAELFIGVNNILKNALLQNLIVFFFQGFNLRQ